MMQNTKMLTDMIEAHPETEFMFFFSPYSMCWWDNAYRNGERDAVLNAERICIEKLINYENAHVYYYQDDKDIITDLDNYMDTIHFSKEINYYIYDSLKEGRDEITSENIDTILDGMYDLSERIVDEYIHEYYD